jgi:glutaredoxin 3
MQSILLFCFAYFFPLAMLDDAMTVRSPQVTLYYSPGCPYSRDVLWHLDQINKQVPSVNVVGNPEGKAELQRVGGRLQVPCLVVDGFPIYNSAVIMQWLTDHENELENKRVATAPTLAPKKG